MCYRMSKNKKQKVMKKKKQKKKVNIDEIFNPPSLKLNEMQEKAKITSDSILAQHFTVTHGHKACVECQKITKSLKITQLLKEANLHPNALEYLKHKYPFGCSQNFREAPFGASMVTNVPKTILSMLEGAITKVRPLFLKNEVHITDPDNSIKKFRRQLTKRKQDPHSCSIERILDNKQSKDSLLPQIQQDYLLEKSELIQKLTVKDEVKKMILGKLVGPAIKKKKSIKQLEESSEQEPQVEIQENLEASEQQILHRKLEIQKKYREKSDQRAKRIKQQEQEISKIRASCPLFAKLKEIDHKLKKEEVDRISSVMSHKKPRVSPHGEILKHISNYSAQKSKMIARFREKRLSSYPIKGTRNHAYSSNSKTVISKFRSTALAWKEKMEKYSTAISNQKKRKWYGEKVKKEIPIKISEIKRREMGKLKQMALQMKPSIDQIKNLVKRKPNMLLKPRRKRRYQLNEKTTENNSSFYEKLPSDTNSNLDTKSSKNLLFTQEPSKRLNLDLSSKGIFQKNNLLKKPDRKKLTTTTKDLKSQAELLNCTPEYTSKEKRSLPYKSRLWNSEISSGNRSGGTSFLNKSLDLQKRVRFKEQLTNSLDALRGGQEVNEMLIDCILYKVKFLNEL
ncbi:unnamed protein product [Moneuplotes crassus]|uniref:Uncharacterized protein n=1 Tax=Euplotes crassus TaxID=5936 RepID=A0AAD1U0W6_EUPCR|nr:unnamed protein product [Moneuplotes crassus]